MRGNGTLHLCVWLSASVSVNFRETVTAQIRPNLARNSYSIATNMMNCDFVARRWIDAASPAKYHNGYVINNSTLQRIVAEQETPYRPVRCRKADVV